MAAGRLTVMQAARQLGVSRKTYYEWENRALKSLAQSLSDQPTGRPAQPEDPEKEALRHRVSELEARLKQMERSQHIRDILSKPVNGAQKK